MCAAHTHSLVNATHDFHVVRRRGLELQNKYAQVKSQLRTRGTLLSEEVKIFVAAANQVLIRTSHVALLRNSWTRE